MRRLGLAFGIASCFVALTAMPARAHATLRSSEPGAGQQVGTAPARVVLTLSEAVDPSASEISVLSTSGSTVTAGQVATAGASHILAVPLDDLQQGVYTVTWRVLSRVDGHVTGGSFAFGVGVSPAGAVLPEVKGQNPSPSPLGVAGRWLLYAGLALIVGAALLVMIGRDLAGPSPAVVGWAAAVGGVIAIALAQRGEAGVGIGDIFDTSIGTALVARAIPLGVILIVLLAVRPVRARALAAAVGAIAVGVAHVANGHAAAKGSAPALQIVAQSVHLVAAAVWIGGLAAMVASWRRTDPDARAQAVVRYSTVALWAVVVLVATGVVRALTETPSLGLLWSTSYGITILVKIGLLAGLVALGAVNRYRMVPRVSDAPRGLMRVAMFELVLAAAVFAATGVLTSVAPARSTIEVAGVSGLRATGADFGTTVRVSFDASPGTPGPNRMTLIVRDYDTDEPVAADEVSLVFRLVGEELEPSTLAMDPEGVGRFRAAGAQLAAPGPWSITAVIRRGSDSVEVPLAVFPAAAFTDNIIPGDPTIHDITLAGGERVQMYVDPAKTGETEVHATFFDAAGAEFDGLTDFVVVATAPGGQPEALGVRKLSPGHVVADASLSPGKWRFDASARTAQGARLWASFEQEVPT